MKTITSMKAWMAAATVDEQELLAERVGTTRGMLYQYAGGHRTASAERAGAIERSTAEMHKASKGRLPEDLPHGSLRGLPAMRVRAEVPQGPGGDQRVPDR